MKGVYLWVPFLSKCWRDRRENVEEKKKEVMKKRK